MPTKEAQDWLQAITAEANGDNAPLDVPVPDRNGDWYTDSSGKPAVLQMLGEYSDAVKLYDRRQTNKVIRDRNGKLPDADELLTKTCERLAAATAGWTLTFAPFTPENAATLYRAAPWILNVAHKGMTERGDFSGEKSGS